MAVRFLGELGVAGAAGLALLLGFGLVLVVDGARGLRDASLVAPAESRCADWLASSGGPRWVTLTDCRLEGQQLGVRAGVPVVVVGEAPADAILTGLVDDEGDTVRVVLGAAPRRLQVVLRLFFGLAAVALAVRPIVRRALLHRESNAATDAAGP